MKLLLVSSVESMGKTTLCMQACGKLKSEGVNVGLVGETYGSRMPFKPTLFDTDPNTYLWCAANALTMLYGGMFTERASVSMFDRTPIDYLAYLNVKHPNHRLRTHDSILDATADYLSKTEYSYVVLRSRLQESLPPADDGYRCMNAWWRDKVGDEIEKLLSAAGIGYHKVEHDTYADRAFNAYHKWRYFLTGEDKAVTVRRQMENWLNSEGIGFTELRITGSRSTNWLKAPTVYSDYDFEAVVSDHATACMAKSRFESAKELLGEITQATIHLRFIPLSSKPFPL